MKPSFSEDDERDAQLGAIFRVHVADLYRYIYRQVRHVALAEDLTSAVFLKALRWLQQDRGPQSVKGWLYATARSLIADYWREHTQLHLLPLEEVEEMPMLSDESNERLRPLKARVQRLLDGLPARERDILILRFFQGYSAAEIGEVLGLSAKHVRVLQLRALRRAALLEANERSVSVESPGLPYNEQALHVLELTNEEARALNHNYMGTEHLLLGILREKSGATDLIDQGITFERMRGGIMFILGRLPVSEGIAGEQRGFTPRTQQVLVIAGEEAQRLGETAISPRHLLVAILREGEGIAAKLLQASEVTWEQVGETVRISVMPDDTEEDPIIVPADFEEALKQHPSAQTIFERLSNSKKKRFVDHFEHIAQEEARRQAMEKAIEMLEHISQRQSP